MFVKALLHTQGWRLNNAIELPRKCVTDRELTLQALENMPRAITTEQGKWQKDTRVQAKRTTVERSTS